jgi:IS605 OrfB family transposase
LPGKGKKALSKTELRTVVKSIVEDAVITQHTVSVENLDFRKKKSKTSKSVSKNKQYNKMINSFDYARYIDYLYSECYKNGVELIKVNPYKTTIIGKKKYGKVKGLNSHQAASYVIGRKGLGFSE